MFFSFLLSTSSTKSSGYKLFDIHASQILQLKIVCLLKFKVIETDYSCRPHL